MLLVILIVSLQRGKREIMKQKRTRKNRVTAGLHNDTTRGKTSEKEEKETIKRTKYERKTPRLYSFITS